MTKVLVITYYWPPAGGPGVQRWLNFVRYLPEFDIEPVVFVPSNPYYPIRDETLLAQVPTQLKSYRQKTREPFAWSKILLGAKTQQISSGIIKESESSFREKLALWIRGNLFIPDARRSWVIPSIDKILDILEKEKIASIITTGPPHSTHLIGMGVKQRSDIKWIADFRDPWTNIRYHNKLRLTGRASDKHKELEEKVLNSADKILTTSQTTAEEFKQITPKPIRVITNGYVSLNVETEGKLDEKFSLSFIGSMLSGRNPEKLWIALSELLDEVPGFKADLELKFIGVVSENVINSLNRHKLMEHTNLISYVSHEDAQKYQRRSQVLLLIEKDIEETRGILPGKMFEYFAAKRPVLAIGPEDWESGRMVVDNHAGSYFNYSQKDEIKAQLRTWYSEYKKGVLAANPVNLERYSRKSLTEKLASELSWE